MRAREEEVVVVDVQEAFVVVGIEEDRWNWGNIEVFEVERTGAEQGVPGVEVEVETERDESFFKEFTRLESDSFRFIELLKEEGRALDDDEEDDDEEDDDEEDEEEEEEEVVVVVVVVQVTAVTVKEWWWCWWLKWGVVTVAPLCCVEVTEVV